jgi:hypothetical protein
MSEHDSIDEPKLPPVTDEAVEAASDQVEELAKFFGFASHAYITAGGEKFKITNPNLLSDEQQERYDDVQAELRTFDREPARNLITNEVVVDPKTGEAVTNLIEPHMKDGVRVRPTYWSRVLRAIVGDDTHDRFVKKGGSSNEFRLIWSRMNREMLERAASDSKSDSGA